MALKFIEDFEYLNQVVLCRFDFNVPLKDGKITDTTRIDEALPTIEYLLKHGVSKLIMMSHLGRPDGKVNLKYTLEPVAIYLAEKLHQDVLLTESAVEENLKQVLSLKKTKIVLLENLRFHQEEENNDSFFASKLAALADIYINDAFGAAHRQHASTYEINRYFKKRAAGFLMKKEIIALTKIVESPEKPFMAIVGGAKVSDKIKILERLLPQVQNLFIGGAMAYPFLKAKGHKIGKSLCSETDVKLAQMILTQDKGNKIQLPVDHLVAENPDARAKVISEINIPDELMGLDIGPQTILNYKNLLSSAKTILWNGPMGFFEKPEFSKGTFSIAKHLSQLSAFTVVGGGDSVSAVNLAGVAEKMSHVSTGGGASLEFIEKGQLPGIQALKFGLS
jgi:phosphoglycerate kinase